MPNRDKRTAQEIHELLLNARPQRDDPNLSKAALFQSSVPTSQFSPLRDETFLAIRTLQAAIQRGASAAEGEKLLLEAIRVAEQWAVSPT